jgi:Tfp pilus assembly protein PilN
MRAVNLLPRETHTRSGSFRGLDPFLAGGAALTAVVVAAVGGGFALEHSHAASVQRQLATAKTELAQLQREQTQSGSVATPILPTPTVTGQTPTWQAAIQAALSGRVAWDDVLSQIGRLTPARVSFTTVTLGAAATATASAGSGSGSLTLAGTAFDQVSVAQFLARLQLVPSLSNVTLTSSIADPKTHVVSFVIAAQTAVPVASTSASAAPAAGGGA